MCGVVVFVLFVLFVVCFVVCCVVFCFLLLLFCLDDLRSVFGLLIDELLACVELLFGVDVCVWLCLFGRICVVCVVCLFSVVVLCVCVVCVVCVVV